MSKTAYNLESLERHGISSIDVDDVIATGVWEKMTPADLGNERLMFIGFTANGRLLEVGVEYFDDKNIEYIFHADDATKYYRNIFQKWMTNK